MIAVCLGEEWRAIDGYPDYAVSDQGRVMRVTSRTCAKAGAILKKSLSGGRNKDGRYFIVDLVLNGKKSTKLVHILVTEAFLGPRPPGHVVNHRSGERGDNRKDNLEWVTQSRNVQHAYDLGLSDAKGERNGQAKLTEADVREIRRLSTGKRGEFTALAARFNVGSRQIADIIKGKAWPHIL